MTAKPASKVAALLLLGAIMFFVVPMAIGFSWLSGLIVVHFIGVMSSPGPSTDDGLLWLLMIVVLPGVAAIAVASLAISGISGALAWQIVSSWRTRQSRADAA